jgi:hypothetical protein
MPHRHPPVGLRELAELLVEGDRAGAGCALVDPDDDRQDAASGAAGSPGSAGMCSSADR